MTLIQLIAAEIATLITMIVMVGRKDWNMLIVPIPIALMLAISIAFRLMEGV